MTLGAYLQSSALSAVGRSWLPVLLASAATLLLSLAAGVALARFTGTDTRTASLGMVAGGASGIVGMADDLGGDDRLVAFMQYLRVLIVVLVTPLLVPIAFSGHHVGGAGARPVRGPVLGDPRDWLITAALAVIGARRRPRASACPPASLLGPMILSGIVTLAAIGGGFTVPPVLREVAFAAIGLRIGLRFTVATVRLVGRLLVPVTVCILGLLVACFGLAVAARPHDVGVAAGRLPRDDARRPLRGARGGVRRRREHDVHRRGAGPAPARHGPARAGRWCGG